MFYAWTGPQWLLFGGLACMGTGLLGLLSLAVQRLRDAAAERRNVRVMAYAGIWPPPARVLPGPWIEPRTGEPIDDITAHLAPGAGSLATLAEVGEGSLTRAELVDAETRDAFRFAFDRPAYSPSLRDAGVIDDGGVLTQFHVAIEAAMRKARLWEIQAHSEHRGAAGLWAQLDDWRIFSPTGELPIYERPEVLASLPVTLPALA